MAMRLFGLILIFFISFEGISQKDSLLNVWNNPNHTSKDRFDAINSFNKRYYLFNHPDSSFRLSKQAFEFAKKEKLTIRMARAKNLQGISLDLIGNYPLAIEYYLESLKILSSTDASDEKANCYLNLGVLYSNINDSKTALSYYNKALNTFSKSNNNTGKARVLLNIGSIHLEMEEFDKGEQYYLESLSISGKEKDIFSTSEAIYSLGTLHLLKDELVEARSYFDSCLVEYKKINNRSGEAQTLNVLSKVYFKQNNIDKAIEFANNSLSISQEANEIVNIENAASSLHSYYKSKKDFRKALEMYQLFINSRDSALNSESERIILRKEFEYELEKEILSNKVQFEKEKGKLEIAYLKERIAIVGLTLFLLALTFFIVRYRYIKNSNEKKELLDQITKLKNDLLLNKYIKTSSDRLEESPLERSKIETTIASKLNETDWSILVVICDTPTLSYEEIAEKVFLSREGVSSSLRKMYRLFELDNVKNKKLALVMKAVELSK